MVSAVNEDTAFFIYIVIKFGSMSIVGVNYGLAEQIRKAIIKVWSTFSKVVGVGKAHKYFPFMQSNDSQTARCLAA